MNHAEPLSADALRWQCDPSQFDFETSDELPKMDDIIGQERAVEAIEFGMGIRGRGYNIFAHGPTGTGKYEIVRHFLKRQAAEQKSPPDLCYVQNFEKEREPQKLLVPAGRGVELSDDMENLIEDLKASVPAAFESEDYQVRRSAIDEEFQGKQQNALSEITEEAEERGIRILQTPAGIAFAPLKDNEVVGPEDADQLTDEERDQAQEVIDELEDKLRKELRNAPRWERKRHEKLKALREEVAGYVVAGPFADLREKYEDLPPVNEYLHDAEADVIDNIEYFILAQRVEHAHIVSLGAEPDALSMGDTGGQSGGGDGGGGAGQAGGGPHRREISFRRYNINVLVDNSKLDGAPVIYEDDPTLDRLLGKIEHLAQFGALVTDFNLIQPGALHRANGGYLIVDARKLLMHPLSYEQLKRALYSEQVHIESAKQVMGMAHTVTLEPEPVDLDVKVVLLGERELYYKLDQLDHEFGELFKVAADFNERMPRRDNLDQFSRLVAGFARDNDCAPLNPQAMAQLIEQAARLAGERDKVSTHSESLRDLIREASYLAETSGVEVIGAQHICQAVAAQERRADRVRERLQEQIERQTLMIDTEGQAVGQVNGLSVLSIGDFAFGRPHRITASARVGKGELVDIERESNLGGPLHSKGVLILAGFLGSRFGKMQPLSLTASLVFEQTYGGIEGDSASLGEVCALLSELAEAPIRQDLAITGSVNQQGRVQAIGGASEKIEGFYDICKMRGLSGEQGVLIPDSNVRHLMVREEIVRAVERGDFNVYTVKSVDQAMQLLTGVEAGERDPKGEYPEGTINGRVARTLDAFAERARRFEHGE
ncbi:MAG: Lon protease family protein [Persicimonas sp.]